MADLPDLERGLAEAFGLKPEELDEAKHNLLGFFATLYKIDQRLEKQAQEVKAKEGGRD